MNTNFNNFSKDTESSTFNEAQASPLRWSEPAMFISRATIG